MKRLTLLIFGLISQLAIGQSFHLSGYVIDSQSGEPVINAVVYEEGTYNYVFSNNYGFFSLVLPKGQHTLIASSVGYKPEEKTINLHSDTTINFSLQSTTTLQEVKVIARANEVMSPQTSELHIPMEQVKLLPTPGANPDIIKAYQLMPGVQQGREGSSDLLVRGSSRDQTLIILDGVPLYYVNHLGGFLSTFNTDALADATLYKGNFPARFGGRLASVLDVSMRNGNMLKPAGNLTIGALASRLTLEYPIIKGKSSLLLSARTAPIGWLIMPFSYLTIRDLYFFYSFYDVNAKWNWQINKHNRLYLSFYKGDDPLNYYFAPQGELFKTRASVKWGNTMLALRWNHIFGNNIFSNTTIYYNIFRYQYSSKITDKQSNDYISLTQKSQVNDLGLNYDMNFSLRRNLYLRAGVQNIFHNFCPQDMRYTASLTSENYHTDTNITRVNIPALESSLYGELVLDSKKFGFNLGTRFTTYFLPQENKLYQSPEPRVMFRLALSDNMALKASYAYTTQFIHLITTPTESELPIDMWLPSTGTIIPEHAHQWTAGLYRKIKGFKLSIEGYYKQMNDLTTFMQGMNAYSLMMGGENSLVNHGHGWAYGLELFVQKTSGRTTGWLGYTYSRSFRQFAEINNGQPYPYRFDRPHSIVIALIHKINDKVILSADWVYGTGYPYTKPVGYMPVMTPTPQISFYPDFIWEPRNSSRMEDYHRLDIGIRFIKHKKHSTRTWTISVYNAYNHMNPYAYSYYSDYDYSTRTERYYMEKFTLFPFLPSVSYSVKW